MKNQTSLPDDLTAHGEPSFSYGFGRQHAKGFSNALSTEQVIQSQSAPVAQPKLNVVRQQNHAFYTHTPRVGTVVRTVIGANTNRRYLMIQNNSAVTVFLGFGTTAGISGSESVVLPPNAVYTFENGIVPNNEITAVCATAAVLAVVEGIATGV